MLMIQKLMECSGQSLSDIKAGFELGEDFEDLIL